MNLKDEMMSKYLHLSYEQIQEDIKIVMQDDNVTRPQEKHYRKRQISDELIEKFRNEGFTVEHPKSIHDGSLETELIKISW